MADSKDCRTTPERRPSSTEQLAHVVLESLLEGCQVIGPDFRYRYVNAAAARHGRTTAAQLLGRTMMEAYPGIESTEMFGVLRQCMETHLPRQMENEFTFPDGGKGWFELRFEPAPDGVAILSVDISARKNAELALARAARALTVLGKCNQTLVNATDEPRLMADVCRVIVEHGGYRMAWIGFKETSQAQTVRCVASAGFDEGYTERSGVVWSDAERGAHPAGRAIRTGKPAEARFIATDPGYEPWRKEALARGFSSGLALPIHMDGQVAGALTIYASEPDAFDDAERALLEEMAVDLGHGITTLRARVSHRRAEERVVHLNAVLRGIRDVNQLITRERDPQALIDKTCAILVESRGYHASSIALCRRRQIVMWARAGAGDKLPTLDRLLRDGELPPCMEEVLRQGEIVQRQDPASTCSDCPARQDYPQERAAVAVPLESDGRLLGVLLVSLRAGRIDDEELGLLREVAGDVALGLRSIELLRIKTQADESLARSAARYQQLVSNLGEVVFSTDAEGWILYMSPAVEWVYGYPPAEVEGKHFSDFVHPDDLAAVTATFTRTLAGTVEPVEFRLLDKQGRLRHLRSTSRVRWENGKVAGVDGVIVDLTGLHDAREAERESEQRYRSLFENTSVGIAHCQMLYDGDTPLDFVYLDVNRAFESLTGLANVAGRKVSEVIPGIRESDPEIFDIYGRVARGGAPERFEAYVQALRQWFDVSVYSPQPEHFIAVFDVISKRKRDEANLVRFSQRLESLTKVVQDLSQARSVDAIAAIVRHAARALAGSDGATFVLRDGDLCHHVDEDAVARLWKGKRFPVSACISGWTMLNQQPAVIEDIYADQRIPHDAYRPTFVKSLVMVPIRRQSPVGAIGAYWAETYHASPEDVRILQALADSTSVAIENVRFLQELEDSETRTRAIYQHLPLATYVWRRQGDGFVLADFNEAAARATKGGVAAFLGRTASELDHAPPDMEKDLAECFERRTAIRREVESRVPGTSKPRHLVLHSAFIPPDMVILHTEDVTQQRQTEEQLKLVQRLEAVGRLAGGVAHDFNNLLSVILSHADFALEQLPESDRAHEDLVEIRKAGQRAAGLTRQLLAFSRKQVLEPQVLSLNDVVAGIDRMLRRLLGEDVEIAVGLADDLGSVTADPGQIEQVIMNLAVNARDAMPKGGRLTIETTNVDLDDDWVAAHIGGRPGRFVLLSIADTGTGMDADTREHIFEPFFTTKELGKGTGLGLSTVYGIVKQSGGYISVESEVGHGAAFKVYLPRVDAQPVEITHRPPALAAKGSETVLIVEDEVAVAKLAERILKSAGYRVLTAASGDDALAIFEKHAREIDLLLADVVMPQMSGRELAERLLSLSPRLKILYMSGYTDNAIVHHGVLEPGIRLISKPFAITQLTRKVRDTLDGVRTTGTDWPAIVD